MRDRLTKAHRSWNMSRIRSKNTSPELRVRSALHKLGFRFRLHVKIPIPSHLKLQDSSFARLKASFLAQTSSCLNTKPRFLFMAASGIAIAAAKIKNLADLTPRVRR